MVMLAPVYEAKHQNQMHYTPTIYTPTVHVYVLVPRWQYDNDIPVPKALLKPCFNSMSYTSGMHACIITRFLYTLPFVP